MSFSGGRPGFPSNSMASLYAIAQDCAERQVLGKDVAIEVDAYDDMNIKDSRRANCKAHKATWPFRRRLPCRRPILSFSRAMAIARQVPGARPPGSDRRVPCQRLLGHAERVDARTQGGARPRHRALCGRGGRTLRGVPAGHLRRRAEADLQHHAQPAQPAGADHPLSSAAARQSLRRRAVVLRRGPRLSVPAFVLHHHQRSGP